MICDKMEEPIKQEIPLSPVAKALSSLKVKNISEIEFILFAFAMILGNRSSGWNSGLVHGYYSLLFNLLFSGAGYFCLCLCMGEMCSALPFSGGIFGFVRAAIGPYNGFIVACCEFVYCMSYIAIKVQLMVSILTETEKTTILEDQFAILGIFGFCLVMNLIGGKPIFLLTSFMGFFILVMLMIFLFGTLSKVGTSSVNFTHYAGPFHPVTWDSLMGASLSTSGQYNGLQYFALLSGYLKDPREQIPRIMLICLVFFIVMSVFVTLAATSQESDGKGLATVGLPLQYGFSRIFGINISEEKWLNVPGQLASVFGLFYCAGRQLHAISKSGLLPTFLDKTMQGSESPYLCYTLVAVVGAGLNLFTLSYPKYLGEIRGASFIASSYIFILCFIAYMSFRRKFSSLSRSFTNPFGDIAAVFGIIVFVISSIGELFYSGMDDMFLVGLGGYLLIASIFFWFYLVKNQKFSEEEKKILFKAYLINANRQQRLSRLKNNKVGPHTKGSRDNKSSTHSKASKNKCTEDLLVSVLPSSSVAASLLSFQAVAPVETSPLSPIHDEDIPDNDDLESGEKCISCPVEESLATASQSTRQVEAVMKIVGASTSTKILSTYSRKVNGVIPAMNNMNAIELKQCEQMTVLSAGGALLEDNGCIEANEEEELLEEMKGGGRKDLELGEENEEY